VNTDHSIRMRSKKQLAVDAAGGADALAVLLVDTPGVGADAVRAVLDAWQPGRIAVARYGSRRGHPTVMDRPLWREAIKHARPDAGARVLMSLQPDLVDEVAVAGDAPDLDTPGDLASWQHP
ncbi:MAG: NTP transferase domain-containing protein, partial [Jatrophihabitantaceae bacterium]